MADFFSCSKGTLSQRRANTGANSFSGLDFLFALSPEDGEKRSFADDSFVEAGNTYFDLLGWRIGDTVEVHQWCNPSDNDGIRLSGWLQAPDGAPAGSVWVFSIEQFDGGANYVVQYYCRFSTKRINLSDVLISTNQIGNFPGWIIFKLQLEAL